MKLFYSTLLILTTSFSAFSQASQIEIIEKNKEEVIQKIGILQDSLKTLNEELGKLKSAQILKDIKEKPVLSIAEKGSNIKDKPSITGNRILEIDEDTPIQVLGVQDDYYQVCVSDICGYMHEMFIQKNKEVMALRDAIRKEALEKKRLALKEQDRKLTQERLKEEKRMISKYGKTKVEKMKQGYYWTGMNKEMAIFAVGEPDDINKSVGSWGTHEQWVYGNGFYLYFENGKLTSFQN
ncbi:hypothetical protein V6B16_01280 [Salinimicrobium catena]|uniref:hypothetical protein n=1 Tax=Salinimicrobium catena TaxID=390640 RepID=UPI002FE47A54